RVGVRADPVDEVPGIDARLEVERLLVPARRLDVVERDDLALRLPRRARRDAVLDRLEDGLAIPALTVGILLVVVAHLVAVAVLDPVEVPGDLALLAGHTGVLDQARLVLV